MSKSKRAASKSAVPAPREKLKWYRQTGWLLGVSLVCYTAIAVGLRLALGAGFTALFRAWGVDGNAVARAPVWARLIYRWHGSAVTLIVAMATLALCRWLRALWANKEEENKSSAALGDSAPCEGEHACAPRSDLPCVKGGGPRSGAGGWSSLAVFTVVGIGAAGLILAVGLIPDSLRPEWSAPRVTWALLPLCAVAFISILAEEQFTKRVLYDGVGVRWGALWSTVLSTIAFFLIAGGYAGNVISAANVALMGWLGCMIYRRYGLWASVGLRFGWTVATVFLLGYGGGEAAVWRFYGVSESLLTGGDAGFVYGLYLTAALVATITALLRRRR